MKTKPKFTRHAAHRKPKLADNWRRPKGLQNKLRLRKKSRGPWVSNGYRSQATTRGQVDGKKEFVVYTKDDILKVEPETHALVIGKVGNKRRLELLEEAKKQGFSVLNHDVDERVESIKEDVKTRGAKAEARAKKREELEAAKEPKKTAKKAAKTVAKTPSKEEQKKEQDKILTKGEE